jgi:multidrug efflux pump subunit AcrB
LTVTTATAPPKGGGAETPGSVANVFLRDFGTIENSTDLITAYAHVNGKRTVYIPVTKRADASTLAVINAVKAAIPDFKKVVPEDVDVRLEFDQSPYVTNSIRGLVAEGLLGAALTGLMVLIFLHDWRSALIVVMNIPFALFSALILLWGVGQTINIMTLGGLALAVGVLVDEATVSIENIQTQMIPGVSRARAVLQAASHTALARLLSMLCILAVFVPSFFMVGVSRQLFVPLSLAVGFAMIGSYLLSSSLVPVFATWLMKETYHLQEQEGFFGRLRSLYSSYLGFVLRLRWLLLLVYLATSTAVIYLLLPRMGTEIFPDADAPVLRLRLRAPAGTRVEETERIVLRALELFAEKLGRTISRSPAISWAWYPRAILWT